MNNLCDENCFECKYEDCILDKLIRKKKYEKYKQQELEYCKEYREKQKEKIVEYRKKYYEKNRDNILEKQKQYREKRRLEKKGEKESEG
jgi:hypothetical protein